MRKKKKIVVLDGTTILQEDLNWDGLAPFGEVTFYDRTAPEEIVPRARTADLVLTSKCQMTRERIDACPHLQYIGVLATGYNMVDLEYAKEKGIAVTYVPAYSTDSVAQFTFALILAMTNHVELHSQAVQQGAWQKNPDFCFALTPQIELAGKQLGIAGFGNIGRRVAQIAAGVGMEIRIASRHPDRTFETDHIRFDTPDQVLRTSDILSLHTPLTDDNRGMIDRHSIGKMKDGVMLVNTARGPLINEADLARALQSGKVAAAALDVLTTEPPRQGSPLIGLANCIITPHIAWMTAEARQRLLQTVIGNVRAFLAGEKQNRIV